MAPEEVENNVQYAAEQKSSVKVTRNSKGYTWEVKVYDNDPNKALTKMIELEIICNAKYGVKIE